ncbi:MAG: hypothetical protein DMF80_01405 [Acidobacteria bacterium]|nr:MAG: hypothetical protein DMF80_01405 [Acidobacteriota bacterium]PYQ20900.1 MAG: hypothetical protein DMF81_17080 [Acidobacteriota bacterium]
MSRGLLVLVSFVMLAATAAADDMRLSLGYAYLHYLEEGGGNTPAGAFLSFAGGGATTLELDAGYHRKSDGATLNTFTVTAGPRFAFAGRRETAPFIHVLGGLRHDRIAGSSNTAWGGMAGAGIDVMTSGGGVALRLGADFQIFFHEGENVKTLRLGVGLTF